MRKSLWALLAGFVAVSVLVVVGLTRSVDAWVFSWLPASASFLVQAVTALGGPYVVIVLSALLSLRSRFHAVRIGGAVALAFLSSVIVKFVVARPRPAGMLVHAWGYSFPSGHSTVSAALYVSAALAYDKRYWPLAAVLAAAVAVSRMVLRVHYFSDVLAGALLGTFWALVLYVYKKKREKKDA